MKNLKITFSALFMMTCIAYGQFSSIGIPDSVANLPFSGATISYTISNPLVHTGSAFSNPPITTLTPSFDRTNYLYFYDLNLSVPIGATITGVEVSHTHGGCNTGSYAIDTILLAYNGSTIGIAKQDSFGAASENIGSSSDMWGAALTPSIVNDNSFGVFIQTTAYGICTFGHFDLRLTVHYTMCSLLDNSGIPDSAINKPFPGATVSYTVTNPLGYTGSAFVNVPITTLTPSFNRSNYLYFYDLDLNVPSGASIYGVEVIHTHGGCNTGDYAIDTLLLAYNGAGISMEKVDSFGTATDTIGSSSDLWGAVLTPSIVNDNTFGVLIQTTAYGICTFGHFDLKVKVFYCTSSTSAEIESSTPFGLFPIPVKDVLNIFQGADYFSGPYSICTLQGSVVKTGFINNGNTSMDVSTLPAGMYFVHIGNGKTARFVKE